MMMELDLHGIFPQSFIYESYRKRAVGNNMRHCTRDQVGIFVTKAVLWNARVLTRVQLRLSDRITSAPEIPLSAIAAELYIT